MTNPVGNPALTVDPAANAAGAGPDSAGAPARQPPPPSQDHADLRLFIEKDENADVFVYRIIDRRTGDVIQQFPREEVLRLKDDPAYGPGTVIDARR
ncbi:MAG: hypothetical protein JWP35_118 [Caulobacter sp.]|jgi:flagellar protein FlaG|nr:hypothetical protein [Caulobacter sp.]